MIIRIGETPGPLTFPGGKKRPYVYGDLIEGNEWVNPNEVLPLPFDLVYLQIKGSWRIYSGWWTGHTWDGVNYRPCMIIIKWRRYEEES